MSADWAANGRVSVLLNFNEVHKLAWLWSWGVAFEGNCCERASSLLSTNAITMFAFVHEHLLLFPRVVQFTSCYEDVCAVKVATTVHSILGANRSLQLMLPLFGPQGHGANGKKRFLQPV